MNLVDANVLLYAVNSDSPDHAKASRWLADALSAAEPLGFAWLVLLAFVRLSTMSAIVTNPLTVEEALQHIDEWLNAPSAVLLQPTTRHAAVLRGLLLQAGRGGNLVNDADLAALCIEHGATMCTFDRNFQRFAGVRVFVPA
jgi:hypothetical protein